jgi:hypothetical protein
VTRNSQSMTRSGAFHEKARPIALPHPGKAWPPGESALVYLSLPISTVLILNLPSFFGIAPNAMSADSSRR